MGIGLSFLQLEDTKSNEAPRSARATLPIREFLPAKQYCLMYLDNNSIGDEGCAYIARMMVTRSCLKVIDAEHNRNSNEITEEGLRILGKEKWFKSLLLDLYRLSKYGTIDRKFALFLSE